MYSDLRNSHMYITSVVFDSAEKISTEAQLYMMY